MLVRKHIQLTVRGKLSVFLVGYVVFLLSCRINTILTFEQYLLAVAPTNTTNTTRFIL